MEKIIQKVNEYYTDKINQHGVTPKGVDWNSEESQNLRFEILSKIISTPKQFSVLDFGCGYGAMFQFFKSSFKDFNFFGYDISKSMIAAAKEKFNDANSFWISTLNPTERFDYVIASGIFNVKLDNSENDWQNYILETLNKLNALAVKGFSYNVLTKYSDKEFMKDNLHYADPLFHFDYCKKHFSKNVALLHDYNLYEFTILIRK